VRQPVPFGKYLLLDRISVGGMAEVFKAKSYGVEGFEKIIAIKRILPTMGEDRDFIKMFIDEAKIAGQLAHANICQIFELGRIDGSHFIAMEYIWGKDLLQIQNRLRKIKQQMPVTQACFSIAKVLEGLDYAHRKRDPLGRPLEIVHRDCSPQNVLVSYEGEVKVIDFGIAKATSRNSRTMAGVLKGKFGYMSPEQVRGLPLDRRSDIFALGTMLYECLTGERLFQGETDFSTLEKVRNVDIATPRSINPAIPEEVERVILKALAKDVDDRYQWCSEMLTDLQAFLMGQDVVFTAKTLSSWLKDIFQTEIDRERQQLEQYKRVGRDGLIGGLPSAEADKDVVSHLGEAGAPEGDATTLGGPSFDDIEQAIANSAAPHVGAPPPQQQRRAPTDDDSNDFGEEAPTEIFGDAIDVTNLPGMAAHQAAQQQRPPTQPPQTKPPKPPPGRAPTQSRPQEVPVSASSTPSGQMNAQQRTNSPSAPPMPPPPQYAGAQASPNQGYPQQPQYPNQYPQMGSDPASGTPNSMAAQNGLANNNQPPAKTVLGMSAPLVPQGPQGMTGPQQMPPGYPQQYPPNPSGPMPSQQQPYGAPYRPSNQQPAQQGFSQYPQYQQGPGPYPSGSMPGYAAPNQYGGYAGSGPMQATPIDGLQPQVEGKRSTLVRDILIGVAIAALVLGGFFIVKIFILDKKDEAPAATTSTIATIHIGMAAGVTADLLVDEKKIATVMDGQDIPVSAGRRHVVLVGPGGGKCEVNVTLEAGKTTPLKCQLESKVPGAGSDAGSDAGSAAPAAGSAAGSAAPAAGSAAGSGAGSSAPKAGTAAVVVPPVTPTTDKTVTHPTTPVTPPTSTKTDTKASSETKKTDIAKTDTKLDKTSTQTMPETKTDKTKKTDAADSSGKGYLAITSKPTAHILVDGVDSGLSTPISGKALSMAPGKHKITFVMGDDRYTFPVTIVAGKTEQLDKDLQ
jgi:eukaryotic-like serine/threonine-protein kinase